jgi:putative nucleotidyltransferase with HDIG domain
MRKGNATNIRGGLPAPETTVPILLLLAVVATFTVFLYPTLISTPLSYHVGDIAESDIKAPKDFFVEDHEATEEKRRMAVAEVQTVYDHDLLLADRIAQRVRAAFGRIRLLFEESRELLWVEPGSGAEDVALKGGDAGASLDRLVDRMKPEFDAELGVSLSAGAYQLLKGRSFSADIENLVVRILTQILETGVVANKEVLLRESGRGIVLRSVGDGAEKVVRNLERFFGLDQAKSMVRVVGQPLLEDLNYNLRNLVVDMVQQLVQPNITLNRSETEIRKGSVLAEIKPILYQIKAGEMLLREGERVSKLQHLKLEALAQQTEEEQRFTNGIGAAAILLVLLVTTYLLTIQPLPGFQRNRNRNLLCIASVLILFFLVARLTLAVSGALAQNAPVSGAAVVHGLPMAAASMILCLFFGLPVALPAAVVMAACTAMLFNNRLDLFLYFLVSCSMAAYWMQDCRERVVFIKAGLKIGLLNVAMVTALNVYTADFGVTKMLWDWSFAFLGGVGAGIVTAGLAPLVEMAFDYTTDIKLLELANLDRPILRRLMLEAPGTYHHSMIVGSLVEAAATEIGANSLLGKVCGYYHDIGKVNKPLYFIENQTNGKNKHDKLAPSMSKRILVAHVKDGVEMARKHRLGQVIVETIRQSHGTSLITYFFEKAKKLRGEETVDPDDFRYPGPRPQTREAGLVMLADVVEAASRTLENPTPSRIQGLVQHLINKVFSDGQLDECELTLKDLHKIARSFNKILYGIHHHRIEYPESRSSGNGKDRNGRSDRKPPKAPPDPDERPSAQDTGHLRRLGLS